MQFELCSNVPITVNFAVPEDKSEAAPSRLSKTMLLFCGNTKMLIVILYVEVEGS